jgi:hypothetical protein
MTLCFLRWRDACAVEASDATPRPPTPELAELCEVGFLLGETDDVVLIGMEISGEDTHPGRWRLNVPKNSIIERRDYQVGRGFALRRK